MLLPTERTIGRLLKIVRMVDEVELATACVQQELLLSHTHLVTIGLGVHGPIGPRPTGQGRGAGGREAGFRRAIWSPQPVRRAYAAAKDNMMAP